MRVREVHARVEERLGLRVSYSTGCSFLTTASKESNGVVERVQYGTYRAAPNR
ncbi:MAG TPA: hypothetical protein VNF71_15470 [Acidimicrobiales bacterium]|nr:hypothetical protein [Acidimicrobiales bacterium]